MKTLFTLFLLTLSLYLMQCSRPASDPTPISGRALRASDDGAVVQAPGPPPPSAVTFAYALVVPPSGANAGMSYLYWVDLCTGAYTYISQITAPTGGAVVPLTWATGISKIWMNTTDVYLTTGAASNVPGRLFKVNIASGSATFIANTVTPASAPLNLKDIDMFYSDFVYFAIVEGTNKVVKVNVSTGVCQFFVAVPTTGQLNGLTWDINRRLWVINSNGSTVVPLRYGDMWQYDVAATYYGPKSFNSPSILPLAKEVGLHWEAPSSCVPKHFFMANILGIISYNPLLNPVLPRYSTSSSPRSISHGGRGDCPVFKADFVKKFAFFVS